MIMISNHIARIKILADFRRVENKLKMPKCLYETRQMSKETRANKKEKHKEVVIFSCYEETVRGASLLRNWVKKTNN